MKVLFFHNILWAHYKGAVFSELVPLANEEGLSVEIVQIAETSGQRKSLGSVDLAYHRYPYTVLFRGAYDDTSWISRSREMIRALRRSRPDVVVLPGYYDRAFWVAMAYAVVFGIRRGITMDSTASDHPRRWLKEQPKKFFLRFCHFALCYGTRSKDYLKQLGMPEKRLVIRCQAAPTDQLLAIGQSATASLVKPAKPFFLYVGRLSPEKGLLELLAAYTEFHEKRPDYRLLLIGGGPMEAELKRVVRELGISSAVEFLGPMAMAEIVPYYMTAYALVLPSTSEPWGLVVNEALLFGCPAIVSDRCGCAPDLIRADRTGLVFASGSAQELAKSLHRMAELSPQREVMGIECKALIRHFTPKTAASQMVSALLLFASPGQ
ncbi:MULTISPECIES: glycosyltransferase family 4 protein [Ramlibacter]|uniref:Glycosyltransferase n=1 Tax=Ramlibacter pinisoli TaxID=2682844 RepID=A0A6N8ISF4_9BURK|nr:MULTISPECIES: glycosyltransferase [Ramlibacter]MBA2964812.1 glycosyltransferase [Ramlibacter sp. CGMCC 1.13660]MVQ29777.1 glycosyltransferase [Ramlibacter pinisoli]